MRVSYWGGSVKYTSYAKSDFTIFGVPYDLESSYRPGARFAPERIREASGEESINSFTELGVDLSSEAVICDVGNLSVSHDFDENLQEVETAIDTIIGNGSIPIALGGDHIITYFTVRAISKHYNDLHLIYLDAHPDLYEEFRDDRFSHACVVSRILDTGRISGKNITEMGIRSITSIQKERAKQFGITIIPAWEFSTEPMKMDNVYLSIDIDVLDPAFAPGCGNPEPGGISTRELLSFIHNLEANIVGVDLVEVVPAYDPSMITASAAAKIIMEVMGKTVLLKKNRKE